MQPANITASVHLHRLDSPPPPVTLELSLLSSPAFQPSFPTTSKPAFLYFSTYIHNPSTFTDRLPPAVLFLLPPFPFRSGLHLQSNTCKATYNYFITLSPFSTSHPLSRLLSFAPTLRILVCFPFSFAPIFLNFWFRSYGDLPSNTECL
jgi:hypothetical protein